MSYSNKQTNRAKDRPTVRQKHICTCTQGNVCAVPDMHGSATSSATGDGLGVEWRRPFMAQEGQTSSGRGFFKAQGVSGLPTLVGKGLRSTFKNTLHALPTHRGGGGRSLRPLGQQTSQWHLAKTRQKISTKFVSALGGHFRRILATSGGGVRAKSQSVNPKTTS